MTNANDFILAMKGIQKPFPVSLPWKMLILP